MFGYEAVSTEHSNSGALDVSRSDWLRGLNKILRNACFNEQLILTGRDGFYRSEFAFELRAVRPSAYSVIETTRTFDMENAPNYAVLIK